jgi:hypothetical protein
VKVIDDTYSGKIVASNAGTAALGAIDIITSGIPVTAGETYTMSLKLRLPTGSGNITPSIKYYDKYGIQLRVFTGTAVAADNTWKSATVTAVAPSATTSVVLSAVGAAGAITYTTEGDHGLSAGDIVSVSKFSTEAVNLTHAIVASTPTTTTFTISNVYTGTATIGTETPVVQRIAAVYASLAVAYSAAGTYYIDQVCLQKGNTASYDEARAVDILLLPTIANLIVNILQ